MTSRALLIEVRWPDGRFHGVREAQAEERARGRSVGPIAPEWPPSPFRLFQALVAGAYGGRWAGEDGEAREVKDAAFRWLEGLSPPLIVAPAAQTLSPVTYFVPNNDLDAKGGDPAKVGEIRTGKVLRTSLFDPDRPAAYLWRFDGARPENERQAGRLAELAGRLHTLGHGIDAAFTQAEVLDGDEAERRLRALGGSPRRPAKGAAGAGASAPCPTRGSLDSLTRRHEQTLGKFKIEKRGRKEITRFIQPAKAHARLVAYERSPERRLYELRPAAGGTGFEPWRLEDAAGLALSTRGLVEHNLHKAWPDEVERFVVGRNAGPGDLPLRLRIVPLPSVGMAHTDPRIRRVLVEAPADFPIPIGDLDWALAGRELADDQGVLSGALLVPASDRSMLEQHYAKPARVWRTVTPAALPWRRVRGKNVSGEERARSEADAAGSVADALRHAGVDTPVESVRVQREPFDTRGTRADAFGVRAFKEGRFDARDLRHVEVTFARPVAWPLAIGNGRFLGLGVLKPVSEAAVRKALGGEGVHLFTLMGPPLGPGDAEAITRALRRAVMARARDALGRRTNDPLPSFFTGHETASATGERTPPARDGAHEHLFFGLDPAGGGRPARLAVIAPHRADHASGVWARTRRHHAALARALDGLIELRAGRHGCFTLAPSEPEPDDPMIGAGRVWVSATPYRLTRHPKRGDDRDAALIEDVCRELARRCHPKPLTVEVLHVEEGPHAGLAVRFRLSFAGPVRGPILLGRGSHFGEGLFVREEPLRLLQP